jgi:hypothetical protein
MIWRGSSGTRPGLTPEPTVDQGQRINVITIRT